MADVCSSSSSKHTLSLSLLPWYTFYSHTLTHWSTCFCIAKDFLLLETPILSCGICAFLQIKSFTALSSHGLLTTSTTVLPSPPYTGRGRTGCPPPPSTLDWWTPIGLPGKVIWLSSQTIWLSVTPFFWFSFFSSSQTTQQPNYKATQVLLSETQSNASAKTAYSLLMFLTEMDAVNFL